MNSRLQKWNRFTVAYISLVLIFLILTVNIIWYASKTSVSWTVPAHLHWIETLMSSTASIAGWAWQKSSDSPS
jgi:hypothetical protein